MGKAMIERTYQTWEQATDDQEKRAVKASGERQRPTTLENSVSAHTRLLDHMDAALKEER